MNCRPGDLAIIVRCECYPSAIGRIVKVVRQYPFDIAAWYIDPPLPYNREYCEEAILDICLRPIRDQPGEDETLAWADLPQPSKETA